MDKYIKLYTKVLDNPKTGMLKDRTWRIMIELFLVAGESFDDGKLPDVGMLSWRLRRSEKEIRDALKELEKIGTVSLSNDNPVVTNFEEYQNTNQTAYERVKNYRKRHRDNANDNADDMQMITVDKDIDKDKELINTSTNVEVYTRDQKSPKPKPKPEKLKFGSMKNVLLTEEDHRKLLERFPDADRRIETLSLAIASKGYKYKDHYATILNWARMDAERAKSQPKQKQTVNEYPDIYTMLQAEEAA